MNERARPSGHVLDETKARWVHESRKRQDFKLITPKQILEACQRSLKIAKSPELIMSGFDNLHRFAEAVLTEFLEDISGGFLEGIPFCFVPQARKKKQPNLLVLPELVRFQMQVLTDMAETTKTHNTDTPCMACMINQPGNSKPDQSYLYNACKPCELVTEALKPRALKKNLLDFDIVFVTGNQLPANKRKRIWEISSQHGFAPNYENFDLILSGKMNPIDIWLIEESEIDQALAELESKRDWYNTKTFPYDMFRYLSPPISAGHLEDLPFAPDTIFQYIPFGKTDFIRKYFLAMQKLVTNPYFSSDLTTILSSHHEGLNLDIYWQGKPMWPDELQRLYCEGGNLHPLTQTRIDDFRNYSPGYSGTAYIDSLNSGMIFN